MTGMGNQEIKEGKGEQQDQAEVGTEAGETAAEEAEGGGFSGGGEGKEGVVGWRGRGKMVDGRGFRERIGTMRGGLVMVGGQQRAFVRSGRGRRGRRGNRVIVVVELLEDKEVLLRV